VHGLQAEGRASLIAHQKKVRTLLTWCAFAVFLLDMATKRWAETSLQGKEPIRVIGSLLTLTYTTNSGAAFSLATNATLFLSSFALIVGAFVIYFSRKLTSRAWGIAAGLLLGGISGNLWNRLFSPPGGLQGEVVDWIELPHWPIFNIADTAVVSAAVIVCILTILDKPPFDRNSDATTTPRKTA
jgi:signal peptidase II